MFERRAQSLLSTTTIAVSIFDASVGAAVTQHVEVAADDVTEVNIT